MKVFLSLSMLMGIIKKNNYKDYWSTDPFIQTPIFNKAMSVNRFVNILRALHIFDNVQGYITNSVEKVYDHLRSKFQEVLYPYKNVVIDESLILWRGNISFLRVQTHNTQPATAPRHPLPLQRM